MPMPPASPRGAASGDTARAAPAESDRRAVTVLFADLTGFTALSESLDPEDVRAFQSDLFHEMAAAVERYEGFVEKFVGDAVMAVFGAPLAHEDDPERALHAALAMQERMAALNRRWEPRVGRPLALHAGINTGPVVAGRIGSSADAAYAVTGDTVNTAARLQNAAEPGQVLVSEATFILARHAFAFEPVGGLTLKGKSEPVPAYRVLRARETRRSARGLEALGLAAPLTGRDQELSQLRAAFEDMLDGRAQVVSLIGEPGAGKSRLQRDFLANLKGQGRLATTGVRRATCSPLGERPYGVVASLLREAYGVASGDPLDVASRKLESGLGLLGVDAGEATRLAAVLVQILGIERDDTRIRHLEPEQIKRQIFMATRALVEWRLEAGPLILIVEDVHWADAASIELLGSLVDELVDRPLMLLLTSRPTVDGPVLGGARVPHTIIRLDPLSAGHSESLLAAFFGDSLRRLPERMQALIVERAGGNPLYLEEIVRSLIADGVLVRDGDGWRCASDSDAVQVPSTIQGLLLARIDRLPVPARQLLQEAAVIGAAVDGALLRMVAADAAATDSALETLVNAELLVEAARDASDGAPRGPSYRFRQGLVREVVYQNMLVRRRTDIHGRVARALLSACGGEPQRLEELEALGHHFCLGGDRLEGARHLSAAGDWARGMYANADAARHYQRALEALTECKEGEPLRPSIRERLADLLGPSGERDLALDHYEAVETGYRQQGDAVGRARVCRKMGGLHWGAGDRARALDCFQDALALLEKHPEHIEVAHVYQEMGRLAFRSGDNQRALDWAQQALARAERLAALPSVGADHMAEIGAAVAHSENTIGAALARLGRPDEAVGHIERSVEVARQHGLLRDACRGLANLGVLYSTLDPGRAIETCTAGLETAKKIGDLGFQSRLYANLAVAYCALTNRCDEEGIGAAHAAIDLDRRLGLLDHLAVPLVVLGQIYQCHGDPPRAVAHYREALALAERSGEPQLLFPCYDGLATVHLDLGDEGQAEHYFQKAQEVCERAGLEPDALVVLPFLD